MADWTVKIVEINGVAAFVPDFPNSQQGNPLQAMQGDLVSWNNTTDNVHQPWETDPNYNPKTSSTLSNILPSGQSSNWYNCSQPKPTGNPPPPPPRTWTVYYYCSQHPANHQERGTIELAVPPASFEISIDQSSAGTTSFDPQATTTANLNDLLFWNNTTTDSHQPWETDSNYNPKASSDLSNVIAPGDPSQTYEISRSGTIYYYCKQHPNDVSERGTIVIPPPS
jgi:plastocyanin